jgi:hypothetical protein
MNGYDRTSETRPKNLVWHAPWLAGSARIEGREKVARVIDDRFLAPVLDHGVALVVAYHEEGETDAAFGALRRGTNGLLIAARRLGRGRGAIFTAVRSRVELMYDEATAQRLIVAFDRVLGHASPPGRRSE